MLRFDRVGQRSPRIYFRFPIHWFEISLEMLYGFVSLYVARSLFAFQQEILRVIHITFLLKISFCSLGKTASYFEMFLKIMVFRKNHFLSKLICLVGIDSFLDIQSEGNKSFI